MTGIRKWDFYSLRNAPEEALTYYLGVAEKLPRDQVVRKKIAHVYFLLKNWGRAYAEYIKVPIAELSPSEQEELFQSLFFDETLFDRIGELTKMTLSTGALDYYRQVDRCYGGIHDCIIGIEGYSGSSERILDLKNQVKNASKISESLEYRNLLTAAKLYEQKMYRASAKITEEILRQFPDYTEAKKILWFSYFELGKYEDAKKTILAYLDKNPTDLESILRIGEIHYFLGDYVSSNLYLNNAILAGYTPKTNLERRLAYNYSLLGDSVGMMKVMNYLLQEKDATEDDYAVAISAAINISDYTRAENFARQWLASYSGSHILTPLLLSSLRLSLQGDRALALLSGVDEKSMIENPNYLLEKAILLFDKGDISEAKDLFQNLSEIEGWPDIVSEAQAYRSRIATTTVTETGSSGWW